MNKKLKKNKFKNFKVICEFLKGLKKGYNNVFEPLLNALDQSLAGLKPFNDDSLTYLSGML